MKCSVCGRYVGHLSVIWDDDPVICSEACAYRLDAREGQDI